MNAPVTIKRGRDRYIPIIAHHMPLCEGNELVLRCAILQMRDQATSGLRRCSEEAAITLMEIERIATLYAFRRMPITDLENLRYSLIRLTMAANSLESFAYHLAEPSGGTNAGV